jgi:DNA-binding HxlR family transcriptional regulator
MDGELTSRSLSGRIVLLCLADLDAAESTPVHTGDVIRASRDLLAAVDADLMDSLSEGAVSRALNRLEADGLVEMSTSTTSPTGKGRPQYTLAVEAGDVVDPLETDDAVGQIAAHLQHG